MLTYPLKYLSVAEMVAVEREADQSGLTYSDMMENAGFGLAKVIDDTYQVLKPGIVLGLVGSGNNGGDTLVALSHLAEWGWQTRAYLARSRPEGDSLVDRAIQSGTEIIEGETDPEFKGLGERLEECAILLDGVLGTGFRLPLRGRLRDFLHATGSILTRMNVPPVVVAVDCPSGVDCDSGDTAPESFPADLTVTMAAVKQGLLKFPAYDYIGELEYVGIGLNEGMASLQSVHRFVAEETYVRGQLPARSSNSHKGTFGTALVIAGSLNYTGAALLAGQAAYRAGAGLVTLAVPEPLYHSLAGHFPESTWLPLPHKDGGIAEPAADLLAKNLIRPTAILLGPGFGLAETTKAFLERFLEIGKLGYFPGLVIDADGLKLLAALDDWSDRIPLRAVLTPHPGEMAVLTGLPVQEIQAHRIEIAEEYARRWSHVVVLKGAFTAIASPDGETAVVPVATAALARAGTGDVLAGLIVGLRAQGVGAFPAAVSGAWIHAQAGLCAAGMLGSTASVIAGDVLQGVIDAMAFVSE